MRWDARIHFVAYTYGSSDREIGLLEWRAYAFAGCAMRAGRQASTHETLMDGFKKHQLLVSYSMHLYGLFSQTP